MRPFQNSLRFRARMFSPALSRRQPPRLKNPAPNVEIPWNLLPCRISHGQLRNLDQSRFYRVHQAEVTDHPWKRPIGSLPNPAKEVWCGRKIDAKINSA